MDGAYVNGHDITRDQAGLEAAKTLQAILNATVQALEKQALPLHVEVKETDSVKNPFV